MSLINSAYEPFIHSLSSLYASSTQICTQLYTKDSLKIISKMLSLLNKKYSCYLPISIILNLTSLVLYYPPPDSLTFISILIQYHILILMKPCEFTLFVFPAIF